MSSKGETGICGVLPVFQTPFREDESIDADVFKEYVDWLYDNGADGIVMAMVSEILRLADDEREQLAAIACKYSAERGPVIVSVGAETTRRATRFAQHAEGCGASALMAIPPTTVSLDEIELQHYYDQIIRSVKIPVIVQDASGYIGRAMSIEFQAKLFARYPGRIMFKPEAMPIGPRLSLLRDATGGTAQIFEGTGGIALIDSYHRGIAGTMPGGDIPWAMAALWKALEAGDEATIYAIGPLIASLVAMLNSIDAFLAIEKYLLHKQGIFRNQIVREPVGYTMDEETKWEVDRLFERLTGIARV